MVSYVDEHKGRFGVEPICKVLPIAHRRITPIGACNTLLSDGQLVRNEMMI